MLNIEFQNSLNRLFKRAVCLGMDNGCKDIWEYNYDKQDWNWESLFRYDSYSLTRYAFAQHKNNKVILTGGKELNDTTCPGVAYMEFNFDQELQSVECSHIETPSLIDSRMDHSCIIVNDYLFVLFGMKNDVMGSTTAEYLDLLHPDIENAEF